VFYLEKSRCEVLLVFEQGRIGFIGLGIMGRPMARNLLKAGYSLIVYDINQEQIEEFERAGALKASSCAEVAANCNGLLFTMLPNSPHVKDAITGDTGVLKSAKNGLIVVDTSSISPEVSKEIHETAMKFGVSYLEAPVSGGEPKAIDGTLAIMAGGDELVFDQVEAVLKHVGSSVTYCGGPGSGNTTKLANQIIVAINIAAVSEALTFAQKSGVDAEKVFNAIKGGLAGSTVMNAKVPMMLDGNFKPGFRIELHIKDLQNALDAAHAIGAYVPLTAEIMEIMQSLKTDGKGIEDHCGIVKFYEKLVGIEVRKNRGVEA
jgi:2-hydroxy-3-oxopropionate reductase